MYVADSKGTTKWKIKSDKKSISLQPLEAWKVKETYSSIRPKKELAKPWF